jgi:hypothetical protein
MNKMMLQFPTSFGDAVKQVFVGSGRVASPDLQNLSDKGLEDIGLVRLRTGFDAIKPLYLRSWRDVTPRRPSTSTYFGRRRLPG